MKGDKVSVIIPFYNRQDVIERAIVSVLNQTINSWELLLIDDSSTDNSYMLIEKYLKDPRVKYIHHEKNSGAAAARNTGIRNSDTEYIALLDSDDMYHPKFLETSLQLLQGSDDAVGFSYTGVGKISNSTVAEPADRQVWTLPDKFKDFNRPYLYQLQIGTAAGIIFKRKVFQKVGFFDELLRASEDTDWFIRASQHYKGLPVHKDLMFKDNDSRDRLTTNYKKNADAYRIIISKNSEEIHNSAFLIKRWYYKSMWLNFYSADSKAAKADYDTIKKYGAMDLKTTVVYLAGLLLPSGLFINFHKGLAKHV